MQTTEDSLRISGIGLTELPAAAKNILESIGNETVIAFYGEMGAGKTTLIKELCRQLGSRDNITSPTFALMNEYRTDPGKKIFHFDFYRIDSVTEAFDMGYEDFFYSGNLCLVEWPEKIKQLLPQNCLSVFITVENNLRTITVRKWPREIFQR
jgi:tRNA threonylcarbamoyladenosine biosynthesis protein TsaE